MWHSIVFGMIFYTKESLESLPWYIDPRVPTFFPPILIETLLSSRWKRNLKFSSGCCSRWNFDSCVRLCVVLCCVVLCCVVCARREMYREFVLEERHGFNKQVRPSALPDVYHHDHDHHDHHDHHHHHDCSCFHDAPHNVLNLSLITFAPHAVCLSLPGGSGQDLLPRHVDG